MEMKLELVPIPVSDVDRAIRFYVDQIGFVLDHDVRPSAAMRVVQLTPPGSACSIVLGTGMFDTPPGSVQGLHLVVKDIRATRDTLAGRGVVLGELVEYPGGIAYVAFSDPDGNGWTLQELPSRG